MITKDHLIEFYGINTPGVGEYKTIFPNTFDDI
jgi:hypothetical protein